MEYKVTNPKRLKIILENIRNFRKLKGIKSETMAKELGISPAEYSKLENGNKKNWDDQWNKIASILGVDPFELIFEDCIKENLGSGVSQNGLKESQTTKIKNIMDENDRLKEEMLSNYKLATEYWEVKYKRMKARLEIAESKLTDYLDSDLKNMNRKLDSIINTISQDRN